MRLPAQAARQLPDQSTTLRVDSSSTDDSRLRGAPPTPDILVTAGAPAVEALQPATRTVPIVFTSVTDPIWGGLVASLARPGANTTGFTLSEYGLSGKWLELLEEIAPRVMRTAVLRARGEKWSEVALRFCLAKNENLSW